jgi:DNA repair exonuclease SbcCD ATPase subunit
MNKINSIDINGFRGIKESLSLKLNRKSTLIYGDNGTGKSSLTDALEWFYFDGISYLSGEEIEKRGKGAWRNIFLKDNDDAYIKISYSNNNLDSTKSISSDLISHFSNNSEEFLTFIKNAHYENIILHYRDLIKFIIATKKEKLDTLQDIIGFKEVGNLRDLLKRSAGRIARNIKLANYDNQKNAKQSIILENLEQPIYTKQQFFEVANDLIKPLNLGIEIKSFKDINLILKAIEDKKDTDLIEEITFHSKVSENFTLLLSNINNIQKEYQNYFLLFSELKKDSENIKKLQLLSLLTEGHTVLEKDIIESDLCPLCLQEKSKIELLNEIRLRIEELEDLQKSKNELERKKEEIKQLIQQNLNKIDGLLSENLFREKKYEKLLERVTSVRHSFETIFSELKKNIISDEKLVSFDTIHFDENKIKSIIDLSKTEIKNLSDNRVDNIKFKIYTKLDRSTEAFKSFTRIDKEQQILLKQQNTFHALFEDFIYRQEKALNDFLVLFSHDINEFYTAMNPNEKVEDIQLIPLKDKNDELVGITIEYKFFNFKATPPHAYLSESHINFLGLSFFLASVKAFNKINKFFLLDDVISSFDRNHRARFAKLLLEKFSDYQILLLTHEKEFFELFSNSVISKDWLIFNFQWSKEKGSFIEEALPDLKDRIIEKLSNRNLDGLGNDIRRYLERVLKQIAFEIEAKVSFKFNNINEQRMASELLDSLQSKINKASSELKSKIDISKVKSTPMFVGNISSHDNAFQFSIEEPQLMWDEINNLLINFECSSCKSFISLKYYDAVNKKIRCRCGDLTYSWKK